MKKPLPYPDFLHEISGIDKQEIAKAVGRQIREFLRYGGDNLESNKLLEQFFARILTVQEMAARKNQQPRSDGQPRSFFNLNKSLISGRVGNDAGRSSDVAERAYYWFHFGEPPDHRADLLPEQRAHGVAIDRKLFRKAHFAENPSIPALADVPVQGGTHPPEADFRSRSADQLAEHRLSRRNEQPINAWRYFLETRGIKNRNLIIPIERVEGLRGLIEYRKNTVASDEEAIFADLEFGIWLGHRIDGRLIGLQEENGHWWPIRVRDHFWHWDIKSDVTVPSQDFAAQAWFQMAEPDAGAISYKLAFTFLVGPPETMRILLDDFAEDRPVARDVLDTFAETCRDIDLDVHIRSLVVHKSATQR